MKSSETAKKTAYVGAGAGLVLFGIIGLLPSSFLGGAVGISIAGGLFGSPLKADFLPRLTVGVSMLLGVIVSGAFFIACGTMTGWTIGNLIETLKTSNPLRAYFSGRSKAKKAKGDDPGQRASD